MNWYFNSKVRRGEGSLCSVFVVLRQKSSRASTAILFIQLKIRSLFLFVLFVLSLFKTPTENTVEVTIKGEVRTTAALLFVTVCLDFMYLFVQVFGDDKSGFPKMARLGLLASANASLFFSLDGHIGQPSNGHGHQHHGFEKDAADSCHGSLRPPQSGKKRLEIHMEQNCGAQDCMLLTHSYFYFGSLMQLQDKDVPYFKATPR